MGRHQLQAIRVARLEAYCRLGSRHWNSFPALRAQPPGDCVLISPATGRHLGTHCRPPVDALGRNDSRFDRLGCDRPGD